MRTLLTSVVVFAAACSGRPAPPPPIATATDRCAVLLRVASQGSCHEDAQRLEAAQVLVANLGADQWRCLRELARAPEHDPGVTSVLLGQAFARTAPALGAAWRIDADPGVRRSAVSALILANAAGLDPALAALADPVPAVRAEALRVIARLGPSAELVRATIAPKVTPLLGDPAPMVRGAAASALGAVRAHDAAAQLRPLLGDPDHDVQRRAAYALRALEANPLQLVAAEDTTP